MAHKKSKATINPFKVVDETGLGGEIPTLEVHEIPREKITAVKRLGAGAFGEVFLATKSVPETEAPAGAAFHTPCD